MKLNYWEDSIGTMLKKCIFGLIGAVVTLLAFFVNFRFASVTGTSMCSTLQDGESLIYQRTVKEYHYEDIVVFQAPDDRTGSHYIKRVIGLPGDTIEIIDNRVYRNGELLQEDYIYEEMHGNADCSILVPDGTLYVMGDNRNNSNDSRMFGPVSINTVLGRAVLFDVPLKKE